jgi:hypothetical protein
MRLDSSGSSSSQSMRNRTLQAPLRSTVTFNSFREKAVVVYWDS